MRVLHVTNTYLPVRNGVTVSVAGWVDALARQGHEVAVWTVSKDGSSRPPVYASKGFTEIAHGFPLPLRTTAPRSVRSHGWDVIHTHHPVLLGDGARRLARQCGAVLAATVHSDYVAYVDSYVAPIAAVARPVVRERMRRFFSSADLVFVPSTGIAAALHRWGVDRDVIPLTYPVDMSHFGRLSRDEARSRLGIAADVPVALYAGRFAADKHVEELIDEFIVARESVPQAVLVLAGDGPHARSVRDKVAPLGAAVLMPGELEPAEMSVWYAAADVFVSASPNEVGPLALIEAGLCGTPAVARDVPGFRDRIVHGENGLLSASMPGDLGRRLGELLSDRARAHRMGATAAHRLGEHRPEASAKTLIDSYELTLQHHRERATAPTSRYSPGAERS